MISMKHFILIAFFTQLLAYGQINDSIPLFEYEINYNLGRALVKKGYVFEYNDNVHWNTSKTEFLENVDELTTDDITGMPKINLYTGGNGSENNVSYLNKNKHFSTYSLGNEVIKTEELLLKQDWIFTGKNKKVNGRDCSEMTSTFRGRNYIAYIDISVPINFGPWKFNNFPGLPILIHDTDNKLIWTLIKITNDSKNDVLEFIEQQKSYLNSLKNLSLREYVKLYDETEDGHSIILSKMSRDFKKAPGQKKKKRGGLELKFEWETED
jgi:GLPGLI family protein